jgi:hypothetical protein
MKLREWHDNKKSTRGKSLQNGGGRALTGKMFIRVDEVAQLLDVSRPYAYKLIRRLNEELKKKGCIVIAGRIDRKFFFEKFYGTEKQNINAKEAGIYGCIQNGE